jgi:hypothetical protein
MDQGSVVQCTEVLESLPLQVFVGAQSPKQQKERYIPSPTPASYSLCDLG